MEPVRKRTFKTELYEQFARIGKALSSGRRIEMLELLSQRERTVDDMAQEMGLSIANASQHLTVLRQAQLVTVRRQGLYAWYRIAGPEVLSALLAVRRLGEARFLEIDHLVSTYLTERSSLSAVTIADLERMIREEAVVVLDVRPAEEYSAGHIAGARCIPSGELAERLTELPPDVPVVAYCRGPYCVFADEAVKFLQDRGYFAHRLEGGFPEWFSEGLPVATGMSV